jgi:hypothetical protein
MEFRGAIKNDVREDPSAEVSEVKSQGEKSQDGHNFSTETQKKDQTNFPIN